MAYARFPVMLAKCYVCSVTGINVDAALLKSLPAWISSQYVVLFKIDALLANIVAV